MPSVNGKQQEEYEAVVGVDFDGTLVTHRYPEIGDPVPGAFETLRELSDTVSFILWTMRSGKFLEEAVVYCASQNIQFMGVNANPTQHKWTSSPKAYAHLYIDDAALGCPLVHPVGDRPYVDWAMVRTFFKLPPL